MAPMIKYWARMAARAGDEGVRDQALEYLELRRAAGALAWLVADGEAGVQEAAGPYLDRVAELIGRPVEVVSVGPDREQTIFVE